MPWYHDLYFFLQNEMWKYVLSYIVGALSMVLFRHWQNQRRWTRTRRAWENRYKCVQHWPTN